MFCKQMKMLIYYSCGVWLMQEGSPLSSPSINISSTSPLAFCPLIDPAVRIIVSFTEILPLASVLDIATPPIKPCLFLISFASRALLGVSWREVWTLAGVRLYPP